jgi:hypothetical protein
MAMKIKQIFTYVSAALIVCGIVAAIVLVPEAISRQYDNTLLGGVTMEEKDIEVAGYKYNLGSEEKLYILANALNNRIMPQSDYFAAIRWQDSISNIQTESYAFQSVYRESEYNSKTRDAALDALKGELDLLREKGMIPELAFNPNAAVYEASLFSAIDILEPKKNLPVWQINSSETIIREGLVDCIMDAQTHKLYSLSFRSVKTWDQYNADELIRLWAEYLGTSAPEPFVPDNPLIEDAIYYQKYAINGMEGDKTIVTVGYYEGIQEFFIRITR